MVHLSVAIGRFVEALLWAILGAAWWVAALVAGVAALGTLLFFGIRRVVRRR